MAKILTIGRQANLLHGRKALLRQTGAQVTAARVEPGRALLASQFFDVVVVCHTVAECDVQQICKGVNLYWPLTRVILLQTAEGRATLSAKAGGLSFVDANSLLALAGRLLQRVPAAMDTQPSVLPVGAFSHQQPVDKVCRN